MTNSPKAYFLTWTTYGTWLPGDRRCWVNRHRDHGNIVDPPDPVREDSARKRMRMEAVTLDRRLRQVVVDSIRSTAHYFRWNLLALDVRTNHVHVVICAGDNDIGRVMAKLKAYASRHLNEEFPARTGRWWTRQGSKRLLFTDQSLFAAINYVAHQDDAWMKYI